MSADVTPLVPPAWRSALLGEPSPPSEPAVARDDVDEIPVIYVAGPYTADDALGVERNVRAAEDITYELEALGAAVVCPHTNTRFQDKRTPYEQKLRTTKAAMRRCDAVFFLPTWTLSPGAVGEHEDAMRRGKVLLFSMEEARAYIDRRLGRRP